MQKTTKNLLTKIFVLLTVIFCVFALALGAIGCANNEETKAITKISVNGTTITVEYSDGSKEDLTVEGEEAEECGHNSNVYVEKIYLEKTTEATVDVCNVQVYECSVCKHLYAKENGHTYGETKNTESTCTVAGFNGRQCEDKNCLFVDGETKPLAEHTFNIEVDVAVDSKVDTCAKKHYSAGKICSVCDKVELVLKDAVQHEGGIDEIYVYDKVTENQAGNLGGYCKFCSKAFHEGANVSLKALPSIADDRKADVSVYEKTDVKATKTGHYIKYMYTYKGEKYNVVPESPKYHETHLSKVTDYTADNEKYADFKAIAGKEVVCNKLGEDNMAYTCADCNTYVLVDVQAAHTKNPDVAPKKVVAEKNSKVLCQNGGKYIYECLDCKAPIEETVDKFDHKWELVGKYTKDADGVYTVNLACADCEATDTKKGSDLKVVEPTCVTAGSITLAGYDPIPLAATGIHEIKGFGKVDEKNNTTKYDYKDIKDYLVQDVAGADLVCGGDAVKGVLDCENCEKIILVDVVRNHDKVTSKLSAEVTCKEPCQELFHCGYADCPYYVADEKDYYKDDAKIGKETIRGAHDFTYTDVVFDLTDDGEDRKLTVEDGESYYTGTFTVTCENGCDIGTQKNVAFKLYEDRSHDCRDYAKKPAVVNTDTYVFEVKETATATEFTEFEIVVEIENLIHKFNDKIINIKEYDFSMGMDGIKEVAGAPADCLTVGTAGFDCGLCGKLVLVEVTGECEEPDDEDKVFAFGENKKETLAEATVGCETALNKYWICQKTDGTKTCGKLHFEEVILPAQNHTFEFVNWKDATKKDVAIVKCNCAGKTVDVVVDEETTVKVPVKCELAGQFIEVKIADCTVEKGCEIDKYTFTYESEKTEGFTQTGRFETPSAGHTFITEKVDNKDVAKLFYFFELDSNSKITKISFGNYCTVCKDYVILGWIEGDNLKAFVDGDKTLEEIIKSFN